MALAKTAYQRYCQSHYFKCDDSWAYGHGGSSGNTIFNITKNYGYGGYGGCCNGGSFWSGFGKGLGWGLGQGIMNFLGGGFGLFGGGFGGFGNFGFGGFSPFGGGFGGGFNWGDIFGSKKAKESEKPKAEKETEKSDKPNATADGKINKDYATLIALHDRKVALLDSNRTTPTTAVELQGLLDDIEAMEAKGKLDGVDDANDKKYITDLKAGLQEKISELNKGKTDANNGNFDASKVKSFDDINNLTPEQIKALSQEDAVTILKKLGIEEGSELPFDYARNLKVLQILAKSGINVKLGYNLGSKEEYKVNDNYIEGKITLAENASESNIKYTIDCSANGTQGNTYSVEATKNDKSNDILKVTLKKSGKKDNNKTAKIDTESDNPIIYEAPAQSSNIKCAYRDGRRYTTTTTA